MIGGDDDLRECSRFERWVIRAEQTLSGLLVAFILGLVTVQVVQRFASARPFVWTEEMARFGLVWLTFTAATFVMARGRHITVDVLASRLSPRWLLVSDVVRLGCVSVASIGFVVASIRFAVFMNDVRSSAAGVPMSVLYGAGALGITLVTLHSLAQLLDILRSRRVSSTDADVAPRPEMGI